MGLRGPKTKFQENPELEEKILILLRAGNYVETAAAAVGIARDTLYRHLRASPEFREQVQEAVALAEAKDLDRIKKAAESGVWQAAAWRLERRWPERWGKRDRPDVNPDQVTDDTAAIRDRLDKKLRQLAGENEPAGEEGPPPTPTPEVH